MISGPDQAVLVSGASFAGLATAFWLNRLGYRVTVVEVADELRRGGTPVDLEGETIATLTRMGLIDAVRAQALPPSAFAFKDADNVTLGAMGAGSPADDDADERTRSTATTSSPSCSRRSRALSLSKVGVEGSTAPISLFRSSGFVRRLSNRE